MISPYTTARIREATDIVSVVANYVHLKKSGQHQAGLCPFHEERTPSFHVNPEKQLWICRAGCGGGDVISFLERVEQIPFPAALRRLADAAGISVDDAGVDQATLRRQKAYAERLAQEASWWWRRVRDEFIRMESEVFAIQRRAEAFLLRKIDAPDSPGIEYAWHWVVNGGRIAALWRGYADMIDEAKPVDLMQWYLDARRQCPEIVREFEEDRACNAVIEREWKKAVSASDTAAH